MQPDNKEYVGPTPTGQRPVRAEEALLGALAVAVQWAATSPPKEERNHNGRTG
jgi:hypothetical protein